MTRIARVPPVYWTVILELRLFWRWLVKVITVKVCGSLMWLLVTLRRLSYILPSASSNPPPCYTHSYSHFITLSHSLTLSYLFSLIIHSLTLLATHSHSNSLTDTHTCSHSPPAPQSPLPPIHIHTHTHSSYSLPFQALYYSNGFSIRCLKTVTSNETITMRLCKPQPQPLFT